MVRLIFLAMLLVAVTRPAVADCASEASDLATYLRGLGVSGETVLLPANTKLVARGDLTQGSFALQVSLTADKSWIGNREIELARAGEEFAVQAKMHADPDWQRITPGMAGHYQDVVIIVDENRAWSDVVTIVHAASKAGFSHARFVFAVDKQPVPPPRTSVDEVVVAAKRGQRVIVLAPVIKRFTADCPPLTKAFFPPSGNDWYLKTFVPSVENGLVACGCKIELAELRSALFYELVPEVTTGSIEVELAKTGKMIKLDGKTPWRVAHKQVAAGRQWFALK